MLRTYLVYNTVVRLCHFFVSVGKFYYNRKKRFSRLSGGLCCRSLLPPEKKDTVICLAGARSCLFFVVEIVIFVLVQLELNLIQIR